VTFRALALVLLALPALACTNSDTSQQEQARASTPGCQVTKPNGKAPPGEPQSPRHHGTGKLWTILYYPALTATSRNRQPDGSIAEKFPWWRGVTGSLTIRGKRIDKTAPALRAEVPLGYGDIGFQATTIIFPTVGCWRVTGRVGGAALSFVVLVKDGT
jgi:hypothetical protein